MPVRYLSTLSFADDWLAELRRRVPECEVAQLPADKVADVPDEVWRGVEVLHTSAVFPDPEQAPALRWVQLDTSGVDHVRETALWRSDVEITTIGGVSPVPLAEYVVFTILGFAHRLPQMRDVQATRSWPSPERRWERFLPAPLPGATVGVIGYGRIGREIGRLATALGMTVVGATRSGRARTLAERAAQMDFGRSGDEVVEIVGPDRLHDVLGRSDYVVVVVPLTDETAGLIDAAAVAAIKPGAVLINVARGGIVDEDALLAALRSGALSGAALDVFDDEPLAPDSVWWDEPNVFVTPHVAGLAPRYAEQVLQIVCENLRRYLDGEPLLNRIDRVRGY
jgi:phosphoglycerate dehydrogenase-like enzyme